MTPVRPTLSVILPTRNHAQLVGRAIEAIATQSWAPLELLVIDDASTDDTPAVLARLAERHACIQIRRNPRNLGVADAFNLGLRAARGDFVYGAASDDWILPGAFETAMGLAARFPHAGVVFGAMFVLGRPPALLRARSWTRPLYAPPETFVRELLEVEGPAFALGGSTYFRRQPFLELGGLRKELGAYCDTFAFRALGLTHGACYTPEPLMVWNVLPESVSQASRRDPIASLATLARVADLLRAPPLAGRLPTGFADRWEREYRELVIAEACRAADEAVGQVAGSRPLFGDVQALALPALDALRARTVEALRRRLSTPGVTAGRP